MEVKTSTDAQAPEGGLTAGQFLLVAVMNLVWGLNIIATKIAIEAVEPFAAASLRMSVVLLACLPWLRVVRGRMIVLAITGMVNGFLFLSLVNLALKNSENVGALAVASQLGVPFSLILGIIFLKDHIHWPRMLAIGLAFAGVMVLSFDPAMFDERLGLLLSVGSSFAWATGTLLFRRLDGIPVMTTYAWIALFSLPPLIAVAWLTEQSPALMQGQLPLEALLAVLFSALGSTVIGQGGMAWLLQRHPVSTVAPLTLPAPLIAVVCSVWWFHTAVTWQMWLGGAMTMIGVAIIAIRSATNAED